MCCSRKRLARQQAAAALLASQMGQLRERLPTPTPAVLTRGSCCGTRAKAANTNPTAHFGQAVAGHYYTKCGVMRKTCCGRKASRRCKKWCPALRSSMVPEPVQPRAPFDLEEDMKSLHLDSKDTTATPPLGPAARPALESDRPPSYRTIIPAGVQRSHSGSSSISTSTTTPPSYDTSSSTPRPTATQALKRSSNFASRFLHSKPPTAATATTSSTYAYAPVPPHGIYSYSGAEADADMAYSTPYLAPRGGVAMHGLVDEGAWR